MKITLPEGFPMPENSRPGEPFDVVATIRPDEGGMFALVALDGMELPSDEGEEMEEEEYEEGEEEGGEVPAQVDARNIKLPF
jgi:hypothetical protein